VPTDIVRLPLVSAAFAAATLSARKRSDLKAIGTVWSLGT
jgi:hypothetical protein